MSGLYRLGVEAPTSLKPDRYVSVKVSVKRPGVTVHTNTHALQPSAVVAATAPATPASAADALKLRIEQGGAAFGVPIQLSTGVRKDTAMRLQMLVNVDVPAATAGAARDDVRGDKQCESTRIFQPEGRANDYLPTTTTSARSRATLDDNDYYLRVAVADANGNIGSVDEPVAVHLPEGRTVHGERSADNVLGGRRRPALPRRRDVAAERRGRLHVALELYADAFPARRHGHDEHGIEQRRAARRHSAHACQV